MAFVDDTEVFLSVDDDDLDRLVELADTTMYTWKGVLQATGGDMRSKKCAWILLNYNHRRSYAIDKIQPITLVDEDGIMRKVQGYDKDAAREYLGVLQQAT